MNKRGIFFTLGLFTFVLIVFTLSVLIFTHQESSKERLGELGILDKVYNLDSSIQNGIRKIFYGSSGISITNDENIITIEENLPYIYYNTFNTKLDGFKSFVEGKENYVNLNVSEVENTLPLEIFPYDIIYKHNNYGWDIISIKYNNINFDKIEFILDIGESVLSCVWSYNGGGTDLRVKVVGNDLSECDITNSIDFNLDNSVNINGGNVLINTSNNIIDVQNNINPINIKTVIHLNRIEGEKTIIKIPGEIININFERFNLSRKGGIEL